MSDQKEIVPMQVDNTQIAYLGNRDLVREMASRIRLLVVGGKHLSDEEALALAQYSVANGLNPMIGEAFYLPGVGPGPGIAGWRKKAEEQLQAEARRAAEPVARYWCEYVKTDPEEVKTNPGDIAVKAILHDSLTKTAWERRVLSYFIEMKKAGVNGEAWNMAQQIAGNEPTWSAVAIVRAGENFGATEKMDRFERACKRAEKAAIRKRFPLVNLVEPEGFDDPTEPLQITGSGTAPDGGIFHPALPKPEIVTDVDEAQIMMELGYQ